MVEQWTPSLSVIHMPWVVILNHGCHLDVIHMSWVVILNHGCHRYIIHMPSQERYDIWPPHEMRSNPICHPYGISHNQHMSVVVRPFSFKGLYKKIGVCGGRSIYQHANNTDIFMYYGCGRWFIGLEIGVSGNRFPSGVASNDLLPTRCVVDSLVPQPTCCWKWVGGTKGSKRAFFFFDSCFLSQKWLKTEKWDIFGIPCVWIFRKWFRK